MPDLWAIGQASKCAGRRIVTCGSKPTMAFFTRAASLNKLSRAATSTTGLSGPAISFEGAKIISGNISEGRESEMLKIGIIVGSTRPGRKAAAVAMWVHDLLKGRNDAEFEVVDIEQYKLPLLDEPVPPTMH